MMIHYLRVGELCLTKDINYMQHLPQSLYTCGDLHFGIWTSGPETSELPTLASIAQMSGSLGKQDPHSLTLNRQQST